MGRNLGPANRDRLNASDLKSFCEKVERLRSEGMTMISIAARLGIPRTTLNMRVKRYKTALATE